MLFGPFLPPYTGQVHAQSVASILFGQFRSREFSEVRRYKRRYRLKEPHTSVLKAPLAWMEGYLVTDAAKNRYEPLRLATHQLPQEHRKLEATTA
jgi:hypothetical protein